MSDSGVSSSPEMAEVLLDVFTRSGIKIEVGGGSFEISLGVSSSTTMNLVGSPLGE